MSSYHTGVCGELWACSSEFKSYDVQPLGLATLVEAWIRSSWDIEGLITLLWILMSDEQHQHRTKMVQASTNNQQQNFDSSSLDRMKGHFCWLRYFFHLVHQVGTWKRKNHIWFLSNLTHFLGLKTESVIKNYMLLNEIASFHFFPDFEKVA